MIYKKTGINPVNEIFFDCLNSVSIDNLKLESTVTGYSVFRVIEHYIRNNPINVQPIRIIIQGYGSVGKSLAKYINQSNFAKVVGIIDLKKYAYSENSINLEKIVWQTPCSNNERLNLINFLSTSRAEIFVPCANRYVLDKEIIGILSEKTFSRTNGCIISGANNVFKSKDVIDKSSLLEILVYPEWISNCGNSVLFVEALRINQKSFNYSKIVKEKINQIVDNFLGNMDAPQNKEPLNLYQMLEAKILMKIKSI
jgi:glutamate dehydrogenase/leucine dehydrogenase